jgi:hypothetical protein
MGKGGYQLKLQINPVLKKFHTSRDRLLKMVAMEVADLSRMRARVRTAFMRDHIKAVGPGEALSGGTVQGNYQAVTGW